MLQHDTPEDFVIATGKQISVKYFCELAFKEAGISIRWEGEGVDQKGIDERTGKTLVEVDEKYFRPAEVDTLLGNPAKARDLLGWSSDNTPIEELVKIMMKNDMKIAEKEATIKQSFD